MNNILKAVFGTALVVGVILYFALSGKEEVKAEQHRAQQYQHQEREAHTDAVQEAWNSMPGSKIQIKKPVVSSAAVDELDAKSAKIINTFDTVIDEYDNKSYTKVDLTAEFEALKQKQNDGR